MIRLGKAAMLTIGKLQASFSVERQRSSATKFAPSGIGSQQILCQDRLEDNERAALGGGGAGAMLDRSLRIEEVRPIRSRR